MIGSPRSLTRIAGPLGGATFVWLASSPAAWAARPDDGEQRGPGLSVLQTLGLYVGIPLPIVLVVMLLTFAPSGARGPRYRPGLTWWAEPVWIGGPIDEQRAVDTAGELTAGAAAARLEPTGGARARW